MELLDLLKHRFEVAKAFTKDFHDEVERCVKDYELKEDDTEKLERIKNINKRYEFRIPYIFATHESMLSSLFDKVPDLLIRGRGAKDKSKASKITAIHDYLVDKLDLETFMTQTAWWFILLGFTTAHAAFKSEYEELPVMDDYGQPILDKLGQPLKTINYLYNDPVLFVGDPTKEVFSPESEFSNTADKVPFYFRFELMEVSEIKRIYDKVVEPDSQITVKGLKDNKENSDIKRVTVYFYYGSVPEENKDELPDDVKPSWEPQKSFYIVYTQKEILYVEIQDEKLCRLGKWHGRPNSFFGFGIGKTLREFQKELSIRRGQQLRYADIAAFPKIAIDLNTEYDAKALLDPRENVVLTYDATNKNPPQYLTPPQMSDALMVTEQKAREDAQFVSGLLDLSKGAQESTVVKTATGQSMFADAAEKRIRQAKRQYVKFYKSVVIMLLKLCQKYWEDEKVLNITDEEGNDVEVVVTKEDLVDINFDTDIDIDVESVSVNKEVLRAQAIELYNDVKDDPLVNRRSIVKDLFREGFGKKDPEQYLASQEEMMGGQPLAQPTGQGEVPRNLGGVMGGAQ